MSPPDTDHFNLCVRASRKPIFVYEIARYAYWQEMICRSLWMLKFEPLKLTSKI